LLHTLRQPYITFKSDFKTLGTSLVLNSSAKYIHSKSQIKKNSLCVKMISHFSPWTNSKKQFLLLPHHKETECVWF